MLNQEAAPLLAALEQYRREDNLRLHMPGHKGFPLPTEPVLAYDVTEVPGLDDLHDAAGPIAAAQALCAGLYGADETHFLVGGSTAGNLALMLATAREGQRVLVPRHAHRSLLAGLVLSGARPVWLEPVYDPETDLVLGVPADHYRQGIRRGERPAALWAVSPTYQGIAQDLSEVASLAAAQATPLLVDEAHGAHFPFDPRLPRPALEQGASAVVQSAHKTLEALTQTAWLHLRGTAVDRERLRAALRMVQTSSPSYILLASLDGARQAMAGPGRLRLRAAIDGVAWLREQLAAAPVRPVLPALRAEGAGGLAWQHDQLKLWLDVTRLGLTGPEADRLLRRFAGLQVEMSGPRHVLAMFTLADNPSVFESVAQRLAQAASWPGLETAPACGGPHGPGGAPAALWPHHGIAVWPEAELSPRQASFQPHRLVSRRKAVGRIAASALVPYPPGIPLVMPGERLSAETLEFIQAARGAGIRLQGAADPSLEQILVVS